MEQVFDGQSADGSSAEFAYRGARYDMNVYVAGDLGGGSIAIEALCPDGTTWVSMGDAIEGAGLYVLRAAPTRSRLTLSGATSPDVNAWVEFDDNDTRDRIEVGV